MRGRLAPVPALWVAALLISPLSLVAQGPPSAPQEVAPVPAQTVPLIETLPGNVITAVPFAVGFESDTYCSGWLGGVSEKFPGTIAGSEKIDSQKMYFQGDIVYIDIGSDNGVAPGQEFWVVRPGPLVYKPNSDTEVEGRLYDTPGRIRVVCVQEKAAIAEINVSCKDLEIGDAILPFEPVPIPIARSSRPLTSCDSETGKLLGSIVAVKDLATPIAEDTVVYLDKGENDGLSPGDFMTVVRPRQGIGAVRTVLGEVAIITTRPRSSVARVTSMNDNMALGDRVELK